MLICVLDADCVQLYTQPRSVNELEMCLRILTSSKGILVWCAGVVGYLYATTLPYGIVVQVDIGAFVEAVVWRLLGWWGDVVVDICEATIC